MLCQQAGISPSGPDVHDADVTRSYKRKAEGGSKNLAATFSLRAVESENVHLCLVIQRKKTFATAHPPLPSRAFPLGLSAGKGGHDLVHHAHLLPAIAGGKVKWFDPAHFGLARNASCGRRRQMSALYRQCHIRLRKSSFDEEQIGVLREPYNGRAICWRIGNVRHIGDFLPWRDRHRISQCPGRHDGSSGDL